MIKFTQWRHYDDMGGAVECEIDGDELTEEEWEYIGKNKLDNLVLRVSLGENDIDNDGTLLFDVILFSYSDDAESIFQKEYKKLNEETIEEVNSILRSHEIEEVKLTVDQFLETLYRND